MNETFWVELYGAGCPPGPVINLIIESDEESVVKYAVHEDNRIVEGGSIVWGGVEIYRIKILEKVGDWDFRLPGLIPSWKNRGMDSRYITKNSKDFLKWKSFALATIDSANCTDVYYCETLEEINAWIQKYKLENVKHIVFETLNQVFVKYLLPGVDV